MEEQNCKKFVDIIKNSFQYSIDDCFDYNEVDKEIRKIIFEME